MSETTPEGAGEPGADPTAGLAPDPEEQTETSPDAETGETATDAPAEATAPDAGAGVAVPIPEPTTQIDVDILTSEVDALQAANDAGQPNDAALADAQARLEEAKKNLAPAPEAPLDPANAGTGNASTVTVQTMSSAGSNDPSGGGTTGTVFVPAPPEASVHVVVTVGETVYEGDVAAS